MIAFTTCSNLLEWEIVDDEITSMAVSLGFVPGKYFQNVYDCVEWFLLLTDILILLVVVFPDVGNMYFLFGSDEGIRIGLLVCLLYHYQRLTQWILNRAHWCSIGPSSIPISAIA